MLLLLLSLFTLLIQTTNLRRNLKKQKSHHPGRSRNPFPLVNHLIFSECDHRRHPTGICSHIRPRQRQEQIPHGLRARPFSKDTLLGSGGLFCVGCSFHPLCASSSISAVPSQGAHSIPTRLRLGSTVFERYQHAGLAGTFMMKLLSVTSHSFRSVSGWVGESA